MIPLLRVRTPDGRIVPLTRETAEQIVAIGLELKRRKPWVPQPGPQTMAYESEADIIGFGGAAGGGKTDLACGKALTHHRKVMILRRVGTEMQGIEDRLEELIGSKEGFNGQKKIWKRLRGDGVRQQIEFASLPNLGDERGYQGRPHDLLVFDEAANFLEAQVRFLMGWIRSTVKGQKCQALLTFNPPTSAEGQWIISFFAPWLDPMHPKPAKPGELRWFGTVNGKDYEVEDGKPFVLKDGAPCYKFNPKKFKAEDIVTPKSRTFIPSRVTDNKHLMNTGYLATLQALPEPLRSQMLHGDFLAGMADDVWQVIPTPWIDAAIERWKAWEANHPGKKPGEMDTLGVDVARGGRDETVIIARHGDWLDHPIAIPGHETPTGHEVATQIMLARRDRAPINIDVIGVGSSPYDIIAGELRAQINAIDVRNTSHGTERTGHLGFFNVRTEIWWRFREWLDPAYNTGAMLPPNPKLKADLAAPRWKPRGKVIQVESKEEIEERIGRSPDYGTAAVLALIDSPKLHLIEGMRQANAGRDYDPYANSR